MYEIEREYKKIIADNKSVPTTIHTRVTSKIRISSIYRKYDNDYFDSCAWETFVWDGEEIREHIVLDCMDSVLEYHLQQYNKIMDKEQ